MQRNLISTFLMIVSFSFVCNLRAVIDTSILTFKQHRFYKISNANDSKLLIFLHGGVGHPKFSDPNSKVDLDFLLEGNTSFIQSFLNEGYTVLLPIKDDSLNWLVRYDYAFSILDTIANLYFKHYKETYLSGFSDGGTGAYKIFYTHYNVFNGLIMFNAYPQHQNFNKSVHYDSVRNKKIMYLSTYKDKVIPYEFALTEYVKQKIYNPNTFLYISNGEHWFKRYDSTDFKIVLDVLNGQNTCSSKVAIHGYMYQDKLIEFYEFRKRIYKTYNYSEGVYKVNTYQLKQYKQ